jgi:hypothetical protein
MMSLPGNKPEAEMSPSRFAAMSPRFAFNLTLSESVLSPSTPLLSGSPVAPESPESPVLKEFEMVSLVCLRVSVAGSFTSAPLASICFSAFAALGTSEAGGVSTADKIELVSDWLFVVCPAAGSDAPGVPDVPDVPDVPGVPDVPDGAVSDGGTVGTTVCFSDVLVDAPILESTVVVEVLRLETGNWDVVEMPLPSRPKGPDVEVTESSPWTVLVVNARNALVVSTVGTATVVSESNSF